MGLSFNYWRYFGAFKIIFEFTSRPAMFAEFGNRGSSCQVDWGIGVFFMIQKSYFRRNHFPIYNFFEIKWKYFRRNEYHYGKLGERWHKSVFLENSVTWFPSKNKFVLGVHYFFANDFFAPTLFRLFCPCHFLGGIYLFYILKKNLNDFSKIIIDEYL